MSSGLILAAGAGTRFGATKQLADLRGRPLLQYAIDSMLSVEGLDPVVVVLGHAADQILEAVDFGTAEVVICSEWDRGQAFSLRRGLAALAGADAVAVTLGDQPFITPEVISGALDQLAGHDAVRCTYGGAPGHPVVLGRRVMDEASSLDGDVGARDLLARFRVKKWEAGHLASAVDVDTPEELQSLGADAQQREPAGVAGICGGDAPPLLRSVLTGTDLTLDEAAQRLANGQDLPPLTPIQQRLVEEQAQSLGSPRTPSEASRRPSP
jgi:CTP:molybdopterin cytidylyltransferase MocA